MDEERLRRQLVERLERAGTLHDSRVKAAVSRVPRHRFVPAMSAEQAYEDRAFATKEIDGIVLSSISQPGMVVQMLELLDVREGDRILEIGTGSAYNAALLAELTGTRGSVVTIEIENDLIDSARARLRDLGYANVRVERPSVLADCEPGFDRIVVTARTDDIAAEWWRLLADGGRMVVPLDLGYGGERAMGFERHGDVLQSVGSYACAFIAMRTEPATEAPDIFFINPHARDRGQSLRPAQIVAVERQHAQSAQFEGADVIVARPHTMFALRYP